MRCLDSGLTCVQDERYAAGAACFSFAHHPANKLSALRETSRHTWMCLNESCQAIPPPQRPSTVNMEQMAQKRQGRTRAVSWYAIPPP